MTNSNSNLITNIPSNTLNQRLESLIQKGINKKDISIVSGYFNAAAFAKLISPNFDKHIKSLQIIFGSTSLNKDAQNILFYLKDPNELNIKNYDYALDLLSNTKITIKLLANDNINIFMYKDDNVFIHSKLYIVASTDDTTAIIGSSNFTSSGLGLSELSANKELNLICDSKRDTKASIDYFEELKEQCKDSKQDVVDALQNSVFNHSPKDILSKLKSTQKEDIQLEPSIEEDVNKGVDIFELYDFQKTAAIELIKRLKTYGVAYLCDPVGAGKTLSALAVLSAYRNIVIITPPKLKNQWEAYFNKIKLDDDLKYIKSKNYTILTYHEATEPSDTHKRDLKSANLIIIDEAHNLRNGANYKQTNKYSKLRRNLSKGTPLLALSATPINNALKDLANILILHNDSIKINNKNLNPIEICNEATKYLKDRYQEEEDSKNKRIAISTPAQSFSLPSDYYLLTHTIYSRSDAQIRQYLKDENIKTAKFDPQKRFLSSIPSAIGYTFDELTKYILDDEGISFAIYNPYDDKYLPENILEEVKDTALDNLGDYATPKGFIRMKLIKSLESSIDAFKPTLEKVISYHDAYLNDKDIRDDDDIDSEVSQDVPLRLRILKEKGYYDKLRPAFKERIEKDRDLLQQIYNKVKSYKDGDIVNCEKFEGVCETIDSIANIKKNKLLIFTESIKTANTLSKALSSKYPKLEIRDITGDTDNKDFANRLKLFAPTFQPGSKIDGTPIDILVATDILSEGQNLQDCGNLINYDIAFNPVRAIQRIGRIDRIGTKHTTLGITHLFPSKDIDSYIELERKIGFKLRAMSTALSVRDPFSSKKDIDNTYERERREQYKDMDKNLVDIVDTSSDLVTSTAMILSQIDGEINHNLPDGIFSAVDSADIKQKDIIFTALNIQDADFEGERLCLALYDMKEKRLLNTGYTESDKQINLNYIMQFKDHSTISKSALAEIERATKDFSDISPLKDIFKDITVKLDKAIFNIATSKNKTEGLSFPADTLQFILIAWLMINPTANTISTYRTSK